ncbi:hypothetical protein Emag_001271 [Eimeria magna]
MTTEDQHHKQQRESVATAAAARAAPAATLPLTLYLQAEEPNELRRRLPGREAPSSPSGASSSPPTEASAPPEIPLSAAAAPAAAADAAEGEVVVDGRGQLQGGSPWWRLLCVIASMCSRSWTVLASLPAAANRTLQHGQTIIAVSPAFAKISLWWLIGRRHETGNARVYVAAPCAAFQAKLLNVEEALVLALLLRGVFLFSVSLLSQLHALPAALKRVNTARGEGLKLAVVFEVYVQLLFWLLEASPSRLRRAMAFDEARSLQKPLVVYLDDAGPLAEAACRDVLCNPVFIDILVSSGRELAQLHSISISSSSSSTSSSEVGVTRGQLAGEWGVSAAGAASAFAAAANARLFLPCLVFFLPNPALSRNPPRDPQLRWQSLAPRWLYSVSSAAAAVAAAAAAGRGSQQHQVLEVKSLFFASLRGFCVCCLLPLRQALQGSWGEADVLAEAMGAVDKYYQDKDECNRKEEEAKQNQMLSRQREERQQQAEKEKQQQQAAQRKAARQEQRQQQRELLLQQRTAAAADFRAQDEQQLGELPADQRTTPSRAAAARPTAAAAARFDGQPPRSAVARPAAAAAAAAAIRAAAKISSSESNSSHSSSSSNGQLPRLAAARPTAAAATAAAARFNGTVRLCGAACICPQICLRLPSGFRVTRDFDRKAPLSELHRWAACATHYAQEDMRHAVPDKFDLVVPPKTLLPQEGTLDDFGLHPNSVVLVVEIESDEEDSEGAAAN